MASLKLYYFKAPARAEATRLMLSVSKTPFQDITFDREQWPEMKAKMPFGQAPMLELADGKKLAQSMAIQNYVAKLTGFYPADPWKAALADQAVSLLEDITNTLRPAFYVQDPEERSKKMQEILEGPFKQKAQYLEEVITAEAGDFITGEALSMADFAVFAFIGQWSSGMFGIPATVWDDFPAIKKYRSMMAALPDIHAYYSKLHDDDSRKGFMPNA